MSIRKTLNVILMMSFFDDFDRIRWARWSQYEIECTHGVNIMITLNLVPNGLVVDHHGESGSGLINSDPLSYLDT